MTENTGFEAFDDSVEYGGGTIEPMTREEILMSESDLLAGLLELAGSKDEAASYYKIQIRRGGALKLEFRVRPVSEDEMQSCVRSAHKYAPTKPGQPKKVIETNNAKFRSLVIYTATVDEDRARIWDNKTALNTFGIFQGWEMIDKVLLAGEKDRVLDKIDEISGFDIDLEEIAGN